jgi:hypothetical protein
VVYGPRWTTNRGTNGSGEALVVGKYRCQEVKKVATRGEVSRRGGSGAFYWLGNGAERSGGGRSSSGQCCFNNSLVT